MKFAISGQASFYLLEPAVNTVLCRLCEICDIAYLAPLLEAHLSAIKQTKFNLFDEWMWSLKLHKCNPLTLPSLINNHARLFFSDSIFHPAQDFSDIRF